MRSRRTPAATSPDALRRMKSQRQRDTTAETALRSLLHRYGLRFRIHYRLPNLRRHADIAFPRLRLAVFVDGCFWHGCPEHGTWPKQNAEWWREKIEANRRRDVDTDTKLGEKGWLVIRVWEHERPEDAARAIAQVVSARSQRGEPARSEEPRHDVASTS
jgi:DNA mismatch endonuclease, patch repair protein